MTYNSEQPSYHILICLIEIWKPEDVDKDNPLATPSTSPTLIAECENIQIKNAYTNLVDEATLTFPRGTIIRKTIDSAVEQELKENNTGISATRDSKGIIYETRTTTEAATTNTFAVDSRIRISLGYTTDPSVAAMAKIKSGKKSIFTSKETLGTYRTYLTLMFDGFITKCSIDQPITLRCESLTTKLKQISCPNKNFDSSLTVAQLLGNKSGQHNLLAKSGLQLHPDNYKTDADIVVGATKLTTDLTIYDVINKWAKEKIFAYLVFENDTPYLAVKRSYFSNPGPDSLITDNPQVSHVIDFAYNVANNGLTTMKPNKDFLAVHAICKENDSKGQPTKTYQLTIRKKPDWDESMSSTDQWQILNETKISKKARKKGVKVCSKGESKVDLSSYTVMTYIAKKDNLSHDKLLDEAIAFYSSINMNGIDGSLTIFGDYAIKSGEIVQLKDDRYDDKNGIYLVGEVNTSFGTGGYRQSLTFPYCIKSKITDE
jgi:hypothetical protein